MHRTAAAIALLGPFLWFFGPVLFGARSFAYRDAANFYYPLYEWLDSQWRAGQIPLWNPHENCGLPVVGDASSGLLYPGKLLFALPVSFTLRYKLYITGHVLLAAATSLQLARRWNASPLAATLCAVSYTYGGTVLFQYCNAPFLVGAAWLPLALQAADRVLTERRSASAGVLGLALAMQVLGGDAQCAYLAGVLIAIYWASLRWSERTPVAIRDAGPGHGALHDGANQYSTLRRAAQRLTGNRAALLLLAALTAGCLAAVQILPALEWVRRSDRSNFDAPPSIYHIPSAIRASIASQDSPREATAPRIAEGLFGTPPPDSHARHIYWFSVGPWRFIEFLWPNVSGRPFPEHHRWLSVLPAEGATWTPSLYVGLFPLILAMVTWKVRRAPVRVQWMSWMVLVSVLASCGWFGIGFVIREIRHQLGVEPTPDGLGPQVGGLYWWMVVFLPGFSQFRYPAKLLVFAQLALSLLAAWGWDQVFQNPARRIRRILAGLAAISGLGVVAAVVARPMAGSWLSRAAPDVVFGPLVAAGSMGDVLAAMAHTLTVSSVLCWMLSSKIQRSSFRKQIPPLALLLTAMELGVAQRWLIPTVPDGLFLRTPRIAEQISRPEIARSESLPRTRDMRSAPGLPVQGLSEAGDQPGGRVMRSTRGWYPQGWSRTTSPERLNDVVLWEHDSLLPRYALRAHISLIESTPSIMPTDFSSLLAVSREHGWQRADGVWEPDSQVLAALATRFLILPGGAGNPPGAAPLDLGSPERAVLETELWELSEPYPRAWIVHRVRQVEPLADHRPAAVHRRVEDCWYDGATPRDLRAFATIETADDAGTESIGTEGIVTEGGTDDAGPVGTLPGESCRLVVDEPHRVELEATLATPGLVVLSDSWHAGWRLDVSPLEAASSPARNSRRHPILRTNHVMRGVLLPAGQHRLVYRYRPWSFWIGATISGLSGCTLLVAAIFGSFSSICSYSQNAMKRHRRRSLTAKRRRRGHRRR